MPGADAAATLLAQLEAFLPDALGCAGVQVRDLRRFSGGASRETWSFEAVDDRTRRRLVLRRDTPGQPRPDGMVREAQAIAAATAAGVPEPRLIAHAGDGDALGAPFILMEHVDGETIARRILRDERFAAVRPRLAAECGRILARIHGIPLSDVPSLDDPGDPVAASVAALDDAGWASPVLELGLRWLADHRPAPSGRAVVHGDFRHGNLIVDETGIRAVLDWEIVHVGDPYEDLGWLCVKAWRFGAGKPVGGFGDYADLFAAYEAESGRPVDPDAVFWWQVAGTVRWGIGCMRQAQRHTSGAVRSVELAAIGRRVAEQEHDVLLLIGDRL